MADYRDLPMILKLNSKTRYNNPKDVQAIHDWAIKGKKLTTPLGQKYMKRLEQIIDGTDFFAGCLICEKDLDNDSVICTSCQNKSNKLLQARNSSAAKQAAQVKDRPTQTPPTQDEPAINFNDITQKVKETTKTMAKETGKAAKEVKNKLSEQMENENVKKAVDKSKKASRSALSFWKVLPKKARLIVTAVLVAIIVFAIAQMGGESVTNPKDAQKIVEEFFPKSNYVISYGRKVEMSKSFFEGKIGETVHGNGGRLINVYDFDVENIATGESGYVYVSEDGGVIAEGLDGRSDTYLLR